MRGPPKKSPELNAAQGNPSRRPMAPETVDETYEVDPPGDDMPETVLTPPPPPEWLATESDTGALSINAWNSLVQMLVDARRLAETDLASLARYCRYLAEWIECTQSIDKYGVVVKAKGTDIPMHRNPAFLARQQIEKDILQQEKELGLTPKSRIAIQRQLMAAVADLPAAGRTGNSSRKGGPVGFLEGD